MAELENPDENTERIKKTYNFGSPDLDVFDFARYRGASYFVSIVREYHERSYRPVLDYISSCRISDEEDWSGVPWFYFECHSLPLVSEGEINTEKEFVDWVEKASPEEIDELAHEIKERQESLSLEGYYFA